jgi:Transmembrane secretion effector
VIFVGRARSPKIGPSFPIMTKSLGLAVLGWLHLLNLYIILVCVFFISVGFAFNAPAWTSIVPEVVSDVELRFVSQFLRGNGA